MAGPTLHSRVVAVLKVGLPLVALALLAGLFLGNGEDSGGDGVVFSPGDVEALGEGLQISNPTFTGTTRGGDRFRFTAEQVAPDAAPPKRAAILRPAGTVEMKDGPSVTLEAETGDLDVPTQRMDLAGHVRIETSEGYRIDTERATLDLRAGSFVSGMEVRSVGPLGTITSGSLVVAPAAGTGEARRFSFGNGVRLVYRPVGAR